LPRIVTGRLRRVSVALGCSFTIAALAGCGSVSTSVRSDESFLPQAPPASTASVAAPGVDAELSSTEERVDETAATVDGADAGASEIAVAQAPTTPSPTTPSDKSDIEGAPGSEEEDSDPWERFNEKVFEFNRQADRYVLKPVAKVYSVIMPEPFQVMIANGFDNISFVPRMVNSLLQGKWGGATRELSRFLINSTAGIGGLVDAAKYWGIEKSREDFGQTLGVWGVSPGPYLIVPFMEPMTVRDGIGRGVDSFMNPLSYFIPFIWVGISLKLGEIVNDRALNLDLFQGFEESVIDLYSAVRHGYLRRREQLIKE
jgi:phospholipid-binding lipoprotein MlaA